MPGAIQPGVNAFIMMLFVVSVELRTAADARDFQSRAE